MDEPLEDVPTSCNVASRRASSIARPCATDHMAPGPRSDTVAFRTPQKRRKSIGDDSSPAGSLCSWAASLRSPRASLRQTHQTPRNLQLSVESSKGSLGSPVKRREKERVFFTPP